jgi:hypothetical protein
MSTPSPLPYRTAPVTTQPDGDAGLLLCPRCGEDYLHHGRVEVFDRIEDAATGLHTVADGSGVRVDHDLTGNPSSRRHGVTVAFDCELCDTTGLVLTIAQHKGQTFLTWRWPA